MSFQVFDFRDSFNLHEIVCLCIGVTPATAAADIPEPRAREYRELLKAAERSAGLGAAQCAGVHMGRQHRAALHTGLLYPQWCLSRVRGPNEEPAWDPVPPERWPEEGFDPGPLVEWIFAREVIAAWLAGRSCRPVYDFSVRGGVVLRAESPADLPEELSRYEGSYRGDKLVPVTSLWEPIAQALGVSVKQGAEFVEKQIVGLQTVVYTSDGHTGLWHPQEQRSTKAMLLDMWTSAESHAWSMAKVEADGWSILRLTPADAETLLGKARRIAGGDPATSAGGAQLERGLAIAAGPQWPWGPHTTALLGHLADAARHWWVNFDPEDNTTAPTNNQVEKWLMSRGVAQRTAEVMATMLRADGIPTGPRK